MAINTSDDTLEVYKEAHNINTKVDQRLKDQNESHGCSATILTAQQNANLLLSIQKNTESHNEMIAELVDSIKKSLPEDRQHILLEWLDIESNYHFYRGNAFYDSLSQLVRLKCLNSLVYEGFYAALYVHFNDAKFNLHKTEDTIDEGLTAPGVEKYLHSFGLDKESALKCRKNAFEKAYGKASV